ncbi:MAG: succinylglutamate desuccinylase/aspartoacylase family protein [Planctomycetes bacterium]|nr:succinylglutamate desuccinylase/aspartoacylase family protein [Planctomycetota bacterium]
MRSTQKLPRQIPATEVQRLELTDLAPGRYRFRLALAEDATSQRVCVPVQVVKGHAPGPVVGITAALHGNEVNGLPVIHRLFRRLHASELAGTVVGVGPLNVPGYLRNKREFSDGKDLNRVFPGSPTGNESSVYAHAIVERLLRNFDVLFDLHTASFGRSNSLYIRADMTQAQTAHLARVIRPQIIVHNRADGTLRAAAEHLGIHALTVEIGNPQRAQETLVLSSSVGLREALEHLGMTKSDEESPQAETVECSHSYWLYTDGGGLLEVFPHLTERVARGQPVAQLLNEWGEVHRVYEAPEDGIVIGKATNPVASSGARILHLGVVGSVPERAQPPRDSAPC